MSYGLQVAQLAGIPKAVITAARKKLAQLEVNQVANSHQPQTDMFTIDIQTESDSVCEKPLSSGLSEMLESIQPDDLTPKEALEILYKLKRLNIE
jgi:DNA mismatch repair protein MutS